MHSSLVFVLFKCAVSLFIGVCLVQVCRQSVHWCLSCSGLPTFWSLVFVLFRSAVSLFIGVCLVQVCRHSVHWCLSYSGLPSVCSWCLSCSGLPSVCSLVFVLFSSAASLFIGVCLIQVCRQSVPRRVAGRRSSGPEGEQRPLRDVPSQRQSVRRQHGDLDEGEVLLLRHQPTAADATVWARLRGHEERHRQDRVQQDVVWDDRGGAHGRTERGTLLQR